MKLSEEEKKAIVKYRLERAKDTLLDVCVSIQNNRWNNAANRLYYACFYAVMALLINDGYEAHTHTGVKALLGLHYVKNGTINEELNQAYRKMFNLRQTGDYDDLAVITENDVNPLVEPAEKFIAEIENLINRNS
ncbi:MAG: HEPN domain-containing protein [Candidatus Azobacteroides sp.]|nr:HEPN domain-containing protein [Candidatus Azobacteroides sp.]